MSPRLRLCLKVGLFAAALGALVVLKHVQNRREVAHEAARPVRAGVHFLKVAKINRLYHEKLFEEGTGPDRLNFESVRARLDPSGAAKHYAGWTVGGGDGLTVP